MPRAFKCEKCGLNLGEMELGKLRVNSVLLCTTCWRKASTAMDIAEQATKETPEFLKDLFGGFQEKKGPR